MTIPKRIIILGISCFYHDAAAALLVDGVIVAAAQEERFSRKKHDASFPRQAIAYCLEVAGIGMDEVRAIAFYEKPIAKFDRLLQTSFRVWPRGCMQFVRAMKSWLTDKLWTEHAIRTATEFTGDILYTEHHLAHAASAYYCSPFDDAVVMTADGVGECETTTIGSGRGHALTLDHAIRFPHSLGLLYSAVTGYLGFRVNSAEYKVMGLAPYGDPRPYAEHFRRLMTVADDGSFRLAMRYFAYEYGFTMTNRRFHELFGGPPRRSGEALTQRHKDIAAALQWATEDTLIRMIRFAHSRYSSTRLCLAGGVALNCVANRKILDLGLFDEMYIQPAAGDAGGAVGAACYVYFAVMGHAKRRDVMPHVFLGPSYDAGAIQRCMTSIACSVPDVIVHVVDDRVLMERTAKLLAEDHVVGWFQGRMEFGPRALGNRSILADPRRKENWQRVNLKIKFRESFRPFAPTVLAEHAQEYFDLPYPSPYMLLTAPVRRADIPAVTHVDGSARVQTLSRSENSRYYDLLHAFAQRTGCPVLINTSFNVRGEPIVCTPENAFACFINTDLDDLVLGNVIISKAENPAFAVLRRTESHLNQFVLD